MIRSTKHLREQTKSLHTFQTSSERRECGRRSPPPFVGGRRRRRAARVSPWRGPTYQDCSVAGPRDGRRLGCDASERPDLGPPLRRRRRRRWRPRRGPAAQRRGGVGGGGWRESGQVQPGKETERRRDETRRRSTCHLPLSLSLLCSGFRWKPRPKRWSRWNFFYL